MKSFGTYNNIVPKCKQIIKRDIVWDELALSQRYRFELWSTDDKYVYRIIILKTQDQLTKCKVQQQFTFITNNLKYAKKTLDDVARIIAPKKISGARFKGIEVPPRSQHLNPQDY